MKMADMAARSKEMEAEIEDLKAQLFRKESDKLQWMQAEWSATQVQLQLQLEMEREQFSRARRNCAAATTAMEQAEVRRDVALQRAEAAEARRRWSSHRLTTFASNGKLRLWRASWRRATRWWSAAT